MGSNPIGPIAYSSFIIGIICSDGVVRPIISAFRAEDSGSNPGRSIFLYLKDFLGISFPLLVAGVSERPKETGLGPVDAGLPGFESLLPHIL